MSIPTDPYQPSPEHLKELVLDYLRHNGYLNAARAFVHNTEIKDLFAKADGEVKDPDIDLGMSAELLTVVELRNDVRNHLLRGEVSEAIEVLNARAPSVLTREPQPPPPVLKTFLYKPARSIDPVFLSLNLRIQAFIEMCRTIPLVYPPVSASSSPTAISTSPPKLPPTTSNPELKTRQLTTVRKLHADIKLLENNHDREIFLDEIRRVSFLLAFPNPEAQKDPASYLSQSRRADVADQVDTAILCRSGIPPISWLELYTRQTSTVWSVLRDRNDRYPIPSQDTWPSGIRLPTAALPRSEPPKMHNGKHFQPPPEDATPPLPFFDLHHYLSWTPGEPSSSESA